MDQSHAFTHPVDREDCPDCVLARSGAPLASRRQILDWIEDAREEGRAEGGQWRSGRGETAGQVEDDRDRLENELETANKRIAALLERLSGPRRWRR